MSKRQLTIEHVDPATLKPAPYNPRKIGIDGLQRLAALLDAHGFVDPIIARREDRLVLGGHQRLKANAMRPNPDPSVPVIFLDGLDDAQAKALNISLNNPSAQGTWDDTQLANLLGEIQTTRQDLLDATGFDTAEVDDLIAQAAADPTRTPPGMAGALSERFVMPPFSILDGRQGPWIKRKEAWQNLGVRGEAGRGHAYETETAAERKKTKAGDCLNTGLDPARYAGHANLLPGTSVFDPVLAELTYRWFCPRAGSVLDPFAGEATKGLVAACLGHQYTGIELRPEQIAANERQAAALNVTPTWLQGDSAKAGDLLPPGEQYDLIFTSPPYYNLEIYSKSDKDGSAVQSYKQFMAWLEGITAQAVDRLRPNRFAVMKVGDVRDERGTYRNFPGDVAAMFTRLGLAYYNEAIFITRAGTLPIRTSRSFASGRKLGKQHQNVLVFYHGDPDALPKLDRAFMRGRYLGRTHEQVLAFFKGDPRSIKDEYPQQLETALPDSASPEGD